MESAMTFQPLSSDEYDGTDSGVASASTQRGLQAPHPLDPYATPPVYVLLLIPAVRLGLYIAGIVP